MSVKSKKAVVFLCIFFGINFLFGSFNQRFCAQGEKSVREYCLSSKPATNCGIGDMLNILSDLIHYNIGFNKNNFISKSPEHKNMGVEYFFSEIREGSAGNKYIDYKYDWANPTRGFNENIFRAKWDHCNEYADKIYELLNVDKMKNEVLEKYKVPEDYFDKSISLHIRCGDTKKSRVEPFKKYCRAVRYISKKAGATKVICFYENDKFSVKTATGIINKLKEKFPKLKFEKCMPVETDAEELLMMSMCKHNIQSYSYFVKWATNFNKNPDKVIFKMNHKGWGDHNGIGFCDYQEQ